MPYPKYDIIFLSLKIIIKTCAGLFCVRGSRAIASKSIRYLEKILLCIDGNPTFNKGEHLCIKIVPIDGKTLRRSRDRASGKKAIHMVSAWCVENGISLGQIKTSEKSNEITAIPELIKMLELNGCTVTIDTMGTQTKIAETKSCSIFKILTQLP